MAPGHDDDLDWLYHRDRKPAEEPDPDATQAFDPSQRPAGQPPGRPSSPRPSSPRPSSARPSSPEQSARGPQPRQQAPGGPASDRPQAPRPDRDRPQGALAGPPSSPGPTPPVPPGARPEGASRQRHPGRRVLAVVGLLVLALVVWLIAVPVYAWSHVDRVAYVGHWSRPADQPGTTYLLLGSDSRSGLTKAQRKEYGTGHDAGQRTDTIMLLYVPPSGQPALISIPRDSYVPIPGHGSNKINAAFSIGGPKLLTRTIERNTGLRIDHYVEVGFAGFVDVVNAVGGIRTCLKKPIKDKDSHLNLKAGCQTLVGKEALGYVRMRKADPLGDLGRVQRQRQVVSAMAKKAASPASVLNPVRYWRLANAGTDSLAVGENASMWSMARMMLAMSKVAKKGGLTLTVPIGNANAWTAAGSSVLWDKPKAHKMFADIAHGDTTDLKRFAH